MDFCFLAGKAEILEYGYEAPFWMNLQKESQILCVHWVLKENTNKEPNIVNKSLCEDQREYSNEAYFPPPPSQT